MRWSAEQARRQFATSRVARLATADTAGRPHLVPVTFAAYGDTVATAIDSKPKSTRALKRLRNIAENPRVSLLVDDYSDDWDHLWWARADGDARIEYTGPQWNEARDRLVAKYPQYRDTPPTDAIILVAVASWSGWSSQ
ncbi:TIGR03668 family PPOX class F420-dependent oxidoreductase [Nocardiopsis gilva YIM 90087]|uniref:TIGR03668 family PPOX class F420-dependent oxidoreductase n=1 Tax=Nocardiopsis gilva YIM 90087 TaxID=1235441 RepID=A0A223S0V3_9ACTN|nr:TIGR03668 family PPOX class F420-dependent oxidoreductase [Nocardiopsis gilva]ASU81649.1 TIGR03668 family PPOX class F420-dependent oxidoreductase [Nocardiopsis gilva YIM 90087]